jgi:pimeloyl-ACP methyl ester carboxylesterase
MSPKNKRRQLAMFVVIFTLLIVVLAACFGSKEASITVPAGAQAGDLVNLQPCTYKAGEKEYSADCGTLVVPENRSAPDSRLIALPVVRVRATGDSPAEPIFWIEGGPGAPNAFRYPEDGLFVDHDFVMVGYRGAEGQVVLECPEISEAISNAPGSILSDAALEGYGAGLARCAARLQAEGIDLAGYTITETIDDMEAAREALGYERINLYGNSYGTRLEMIYEWRYPDSLNRVVMVAVNPPGHFIWEAEVLDAQVADYSKLCAQDAECSTRTDDLVGTMRQVSRNMPNRWLFIPIDEDAVRLVTYFMFVESVQPPDAPVPLSGPAAVDIWLAAADGDASGMALASISRNLFLPNLFTWGHFSAMGTSVNDYLDPTRDYPTELTPPDPIIGAPFSYFLWGAIQGWPATSIPEEYLEVQSSDVETLLVSGSIDFATPPQFATEELLPHLSNGEQVILEDFGHTESFFNSQPEARAHMVTTFFNTGEVDASLYTYQPLDFDVGLGWPGLAKVLLGILLVVIVIVVAVVWLIVWLVRRRRAGQVES